MPGLIIFFGKRIRVAQLAQSLELDPFDKVGVLDVNLAISRIFCS